VANLKINFCDELVKKLEWTHRTWRYWGKRWKCVWL